MSGPSWEDVAMARQETIDRLRAERDRLREQNNQRAGVLLHLASVLGDAPTRVERDLPDAVADIIAERDRLRAVVEAAHELLDHDEDTGWWSDGHTGLKATLDAIDEGEGT